MTKSRSRRITTIIRYTVLTIWAIVAFFPIYWMISTSFKIDTQWFAWPPIYVPDPPTLANYLNVWLGAQEYASTQYAISSQTPLASLLNSTIIATTSTLLAVTFGAVIAYGVSRHQILSEARMFQLLMLRMIPPIVVVAPLSLYYSALGLLDTMFGLILIYFLTNLPYAVWMTKSFIDEVPREIEQAAEILGASRWRIFWEVQVPLLRPVIFLALVLRFLEAMAEFPKTWSLFQGGPGSSTETIPVYIFLTTWQYFQISKGAALSYVAMVLMVVIVLMAIQLLRREKRALDAMYGSKPEVAS